MEVIIELVVTVSVLVVVAEAVVDVFFALVVNVVLVLAAVAEVVVDVFVVRVVAVALVLVVVGEVFVDVFAVRVDVVLLRPASHGKPTIACAPSPRERSAAAEWSCCPSRPHPREPSCQSWPSHVGRAAHPTACGLGERECRLAAGWSCCPSRPHPREPSCQNWPSHGGQAARTPARCGCARRTCRGTCTGRR